VAADHDLAGRIEVGGTTISSLATAAQTSSTSASSAPSTAAIAPVPAGTAACIRRPRSRTRRAAWPSDSAPAGDQGRVFAEAVPGELRRLRATGRDPGAPRGNPGREQRRLGEFGLVELFLGAGLRQRPEVDAAAVGGFGEGLAHGRMGVGEVREHAQGLRALAGKHERERRLHGS
jgi:hypothetical protein